LLIDSADDLHRQEPSLFLCRMARVSQPLEDEVSVHVQAFRFRRPAISNLDGAGTGGE
jgi:hypothetical protein